MKKTPSQISSGERLPPRPQSVEEFMRFIFPMIALPFLVSAGVAQLPMNFEPNVGQAEPGALFLARGAGYAVQLTRSGPVLAVKNGAAHLRIAFAGGRASTLQGETALEGKVNYFLSKDRKDWHAGVPTYRQVRQQAVYPGIDVVYYGTQRLLEYDFVVQAGADPRAIRLRFDGAGKPVVNPAGELQFRGGVEAFTQHAPVAYQVREGVRSPVGARYRVLPNAEVAIEVDAYDKALPLTVDPTLSYAPYLGGNNNDGIMAMQVDATGSLYIAGFTASANFQTKTGAVQAAYGGRTSSEAYFGFCDAFVAKLNPAGTAFVYCTYLGGGGDDFATALAIDSDGNAYVAGSTQSLNFPVSAGAYQTRFGGSIDDPFYSRGDAFVVKLSPAGDRIVWAVSSAVPEMRWPGRSRLMHRTMW